MDKILSFWYFFVAFQHAMSSRYCLLSRQYSLTNDLQNLTLTDWKICSKKAVILEVVIFPADCKSRTGMSKK